jgi:hypothetical protein
LIFWGGGFQTVAELLELEDFQLSSVLGGFRDGDEDAYEPVKGPTFGNANRDGRSLLDRRATALGIGRLNSNPTTGDL